MEYLYAAVGSRPRTLSRPHEITTIIEGHGKLSAEVWQRALDAAVIAHPGSRLRIEGKRKRARWNSDGVPPRLRMVADCSWDGQSELGSEFIWTQALSILDGPTCELVIAERGDRTFVIFRVLHAVMDGRGQMQFIYEIFRALRGEVPNTTNFTWTCEDLIRSLNVLYTKAKPTSLKHYPTSNATGSPQGDDLGEAWRRFSLKGPQRQLMPRIAEAMAAYIQQDSEQPAFFYVPVDLRRHVPGISSTMNYARVMGLRLCPGQGAAHFSEQLNGMLAEYHDLSFNKFRFALLDLARYLSFSFIDYLHCRSLKKIEHRKAANTCAISNIGKVASSDLRCPGFEPEKLYAYSHQCNTYCLMIGLDDHCEIVIGMPQFYASNGRLDAFTQYLEQKIGAEPR